MSASEPVFWMTMTYGCRPSCGREWIVYLEEGCEGPKDQYVPGRWPNDHPIDPGREIDIPITAAGRTVIPVPFVIGRCPDCAHDVTHVRWSDDRTLDPRPPLSEISTEPRFRYDQPTREQRRRDRSVLDVVCGRPEAWPS